MILTNRNKKVYLTLALTLARLFPRGTYTSRELAVERLVAAVDEATVADPYPVSELGDASHASTNEYLLDAPVVHGQPFRRGNGGQLVDVVGRAVLLEQLLRRLLVDTRRWEIENGHSSEHDSQLICSPKFKTTTTDVKTEIKLASQVAT